MVSRVRTAGMLNGHGEIRANAKSHERKVHTRIPSAGGAENFIQAGQSKARQSHLGGRVALTEGFLVPGAPVGCREIHATARLGQGKVHG